MAEEIYSTMKSSEELKVRPYASGQWNAAHLRTSWTHIAQRSPEFREKFFRTLYSGYDFRVHPVSVNQLAQRLGQLRDADLEAILHHNETLSATQSAAEKGFWVLRNKSMSDILTKTLQGHARDKPREILREGILNAIRAVNPNLLAAQPAPVPPAPVPPVPPVPVPPPRGPPRRPPRQPPRRPPRQPPRRPPRQPPRRPPRQPPRRPPRQPPRRPPRQPRPPRDREIVNRVFEQWHRFTETHARGMGTREGRELADQLARNRRRHLAISVERKRALLTNLFKRAGHQGLAPHSAHRNVALDALLIRGRRGVPTAAGDYHAHLLDVLQRHNPGRRGFVPFDPNHANEQNPAVQNGRLVAFDHRDLAAGRVRYRVGRRGLRANEAQLGLFSLHAVAGTLRNLGARAGADHQWVLKQVAGHARDRYQELLQRHAREQSRRQDLHDRQHGPKLGANGWLNKLNQVAGSNRALTAAQRRTLGNMHTHLRREFARLRDPLHQVPVFNHLQAVDLIRRSRTPLTQAQKGSLRALRTHWQGEINNHQQALDHHDARAQTLRNALRNLRTLAQRGR